MKNNILFLPILVLFSFSQGAFAMNPVTLPLDADKVMSRELPNLKDIDWEVGEYQIRRIKKGFVKVGSLKSWVDREEGGAFWLLSELKIILQKTKKIEILMDRKTGEILKYIEDGKEKEAPDTTKMDECQEISEVNNTVTVPAGQFDAVQTILRCEDETLAIWINHGEVNMGGHVQQALLGEDEDPSKPEYLIELEKFGKN